MDGCQLRSTTLVRRLTAHRSAWRYGGPEPPAGAMFT